MNGRSLRFYLASCAALSLAGCGGDAATTSDPSALAVVPASLPDPTSTPKPTPAAATVAPSATAAPVVTAVTQRVVAQFDNPWAMVFLPDGRLLVTEKPGKLWLVTAAGAKQQVSGVPAVFYSGQLGLQDVALDPGYASNHRIWLSYAEPGTGGQQLAVTSATLSTVDAPALSAVKVVWRAQPTTTGGQLGARMAFSRDGRYLFIATGERQQKEPAQNLGGTLGKIIRLNVDGTIPSDNPFVSKPGARPEIWSLGHRNPYGLVFTPAGNLYEAEMGPKGGDEFNRINRGVNYGWPRVSEGDDYDGTPIPRHSTNPSYRAPLVSWTPVIAPGGMILYHGNTFSGWDGSFVLAGLVSQGLVLVSTRSGKFSEDQRISLGYRTREVEEAPDGMIWVLRDGGTGSLVRLTPA